MECHGWTLLFHDCLIGQLKKLEAASVHAKTQDPEGFESNANVKLLFSAIAKLVIILHSESGTLYHY